MPLEKEQSLFLIQDHQAMNIVFKITDLTLIYFMSIEIQQTSSQINKDMITKIKVICIHVPEYLKECHLNNFGIVSKSIHLELTTLYMLKSSSLANGCNHKFKIVKIKKAMMNI